MPQPYLSLEAELHDAFWAAEDEGSEIRLMAEFLKKHPGRALEIGCGSGRLILPLIQTGLEVEGLELSEDMLNLCRARAEEDGLNVELHKGDMSAWIPAKRYDSLLVPAFTLQLSDDPLATLRHWQQFLKPGGGLYLTLFVPFAEIEGDLPEGEWYPDHQATLADGQEAKLESRHRLDMKRQLLHREHRYFLSGKESRQHRSKQTLHWYSYRQISRMLELAGFQISNAFTDFDPSQPVVDPDSADFDGILTFHTKMSPP
jgi:SAM-dependent methyltransferase